MEHLVRVKTSACVKDVLEKLREIEPEAKKAKVLRMMEVLPPKVYKVIVRREPVDFAERRLPACFQSGGISVSPFDRGISNDQKFRPEG